MLASSASDVSSFYIAQGLTLSQPQIYRKGVQLATCQEHCNDDNRQLEMPVTLLVPHPRLNSQKT